MRKVIILNGASCSGKSSIAREICKYTNNRFVHIQVDEVKKWLFTILDLHDSLRKNGRSVCDDILLKTASIFLENNKDIVIDTIFNGDDAVKIAKKHIDFFKNEKVIFLGIKCSTQERLRRFKQYNDNILRNEKAIIDQNNVFDLCNSLYNAWFDSEDLNAVKIVEKILYQFD